MCHEENLEQELEKLTIIFQENGYNKQLIKSIIRQTGEERLPKEEPEEKEKIVIMPYVQNTTDRIGKLLRKHNIKPVFKPLKTIKDTIPSTKDKVPLETEGVYKITCGCGKHYVGQTGRQIKTRIKEHESDTRHARVKKSAVAEHSAECQKTVDFTKAKVLSRETRWTDQMVRESIEIYKHGNNFNREDGFTLPRAWKPILQKRQISKSHQAENWEENLNQGHTQEMGQRQDNTPDSHSEDHTQHIEGRSHTHVTGHTLGAGTNQERDHTQLGPITRSQSRRNPQW